MARKPPGGPGAAPAAAGPTARERVTDSLYALGWAGLKRLPEPTAVRLGRTMADTAWKRRGRGVVQLERNLARVVPDASPERLAELSRAGMRSYLRYWTESFRLPVWTERMVTERVHVHDLDRLTDGIASDRGVILVLPHLGNWDLAAAYLNIGLRTPFTTVAERLKPESLYERFVAYRESLGAEVLPHQGAAAFGTLARRLRAGGLVALVADRDLTASGVPVDFFGERARMPGAPAMLAQQTGALLLPATLWFDGTPVMQGRVYPPVEVPTTGDRREKAQVMTQAMADVFAAGIAEHPTDWHMLQPFWDADTGRGGDGPPADGRGTGGRDADTGRREEIG
ncbi:phosphatidylinositol mannoside acyltransferase [Streptomyces sp. Z26]|uniref:phosphatidylinositol mannoside acyltransferase n=1 Tax=Streptomyces TaxID=1883 RepID=UPI000EF14330|nr:phosphatidylinositol mannoside acyltransferase [Streptomyces sp. Z26]RLL65820.1 phosphatidylinositol mannoside acyltransferase [Streptomyces sp. Z26]